MAMKEQQHTKLYGKEAARLLGCVVGSLAYAAGINLFLVPMGLYSGGIMGIAQVIRTILERYFDLHVENVDLAGVIYYVINIPILIYAFPRLEKIFFVKTFFAVTATTLGMSFIPSVMILEDPLTSVLVGAVIAGAGTGFLLRMSGSGGGMDIVGMLMVKRGGNISVGKVNIIVNCVLYGVCLFLFNIQTVIYSALFAVIYGVAMDKIHTQNINVEVKVITKGDIAGMEKEIMEKLARGVTEIKSVGAYTHESSRILFILASKYELRQLRDIIHSHDPNAFVIVDEGIWVDGNFIKKL